MAQVLSWRDEITKGEALLTTLSRYEYSLERILGDEYDSVTAAIKDAKSSASTPTAIDTRSKSESVDDQPPTKRQKVTN